MSRLIVAVCLAGCFVMEAASEASRYYKEGRKAEKAGEMAKAYMLYSRAAALEPGNRAYWQRSQAVRSRAAMQSKVAVAGSDNIVEDADLAALLGDVTDREMNESRKPQPPSELKGGADRKNLDLRGDTRALYEQMSKAFGLDVVFDGDFQAGTSTRFRMDEADYREALHALQTATSTFIVPLSEKLFLAVNDTPQKRGDTEPNVSVMISIPQPVPIQDVQELARTVQQVMEIRKFVVDSSRRVAVMSDRISKVRPAQKLFEDLLYYRPEVAVELEFVEASRSDLLNLGLTLPTSFPVTTFTTILGNVPSVPQGIGALLRIGGGQTLFGIGISGAEMIARMRKSSARTLLRTMLRATDGAAAQFHVGDKYPILTAGYFGGQDSSNPNAYRPPPTFNFEDLGLAVKITPRIHDSNEVTLVVEAEFKVLSGAAINGIPVISTRKVSSQVRVKTGEWGILAGLMNSQEARTIQGLAGLSQIPGLGSLMKQRSTTKDDSEVLILIKPHVLGTPASEIVTRTWWVGPEGRLRIPL